ncbi:hypothetical protein [Paracoccus indicus]|uniref:hypothetical protein n=1 Tax=Paracoccus indicus TaxID=2079229 RepID=UPI003AB03924
MPELGTITGEHAAALVGLAPVAHDGGTLRGKAEHCRQSPCSEVCEVPSCTGRRAL